MVDDRGRMLPLYQPRYRMNLQLIIKRTSLGGII